MNTKFLSLLFILIACASCNEVANFVNGDIRVNIHEKEKTPVINQVKILNDQIIVSGSNLNSVTTAKVGAHDFQIESKTADKLILNAKSALSFFIGQTLNLVISNASASATFPFTFELQNGQVTASKLHHMNASTGDFLQFNGANWEPASISTNQVYVGIYNASTDTPNLSAGVAAAGTYYIVTTAGSQDLGSGVMNFDVGDWVISDGTNWSKVAVGTNTVSNFNGRTGAVVPLSGDYSWSMLSKAAGKLTGSKLSEIADIDIAGIQDGDILIWNSGTSKWESGPQPSVTIPAGSVTNTQIASSAVDSSKIVDGSIVNADISATAAIDQSKINGLTTALSGKEATITAGTAAQYWSGTKTWQNLNSAVIGSALTGFSSTTGAITAADSILSAFNKLTGNLGVVAASQGNYVLKSGDTMSGALAMGGNKITGLGTPTNPTDAATMAYVDSKAGTASQWTTAGSNIHYNSGNVGIGTASPAKSLHVYGTSGWPEVRIEGTGASVGASLSILGDDSVKSAIRLQTGDGGTNYWDLQGFGINSGSASLRDDLVFQHFNTTTTTPFIIKGASGNVGIGTIQPAEKLSVVGNIALTGKVRMQSDTVNYVELLAPTGLSSTLTFRLPASAGSSGQALTTDGAGNLSWAAVSSGAIADGSVSYTKLNLADGDIPLTKLAGASDATKYLKGNKTWGTFITDVLASTFATVTPSNTAIANGDSLQTVVNKTQGQISNLASNSLNKTGADSVTGTLTINAATGALKIPATPSGVDLTDAANVQYVQNYVGTFGQWIKNATNVGYTAGKVGVGTTTPYGMLHLQTDVHDVANIDSFSSAHVNNSADLVLRRGRGTAAAPQGALAGDRLGYVGAFGVLDDGTFSPSGTATMEIFATENQTTTTRGSHIIFGTTAAGTTSRKEKLRISDSGKIGIGNAAPESLLHLTSQSAGPIALGSETSILLESNPTNPGNQGYIGSLWFGSREAGNEGTTKAAGILGYMAEDVTATSSPADLLFMTTPTGSINALERMKITSAGNVGIGTTAPSAKLVVSENAATSPVPFGGRQLHIVGADGGNAGVQIDGYGTSVGTRPLISFRQAGGTAAAPTPTLVNDVLGSVGWWGRGATGFSSTQRAEIRVDASENWSDAAQGTLMTLRTTPNGSTTSAERLRIDHNGNVGINSASPNARLEVVAGALADGKSGVHISATGVAPTSGTYGSSQLTLNPVTHAFGAGPRYLNFYTNQNVDGHGFSVSSGFTEFYSNQSFAFFVRPNRADINGTYTSTEVMRIDNGGNVGIGIAASGYKLHVNGAVAGIGAYNALSDRRYKKDFESIPDALERVVKLNGLYYKWKQEEHPDLKFEKGRDMGVIAQEVQKLFPEAVSTDKKSGIMSVAYSKLIAPIIEAIKDLFGQMKALKREIASLREENNNLNASVKNLTEQNEALKEALCETNPKVKICRSKK